VISVISPVLSTMHEHLFSFARAPDQEAEASSDENADFDDLIRVSRMDGVRKEESSHYDKQDSAEDDL
jgi:hypothetical protein